jgi:hypothetical protein
MTPRLFFNFVLLIVATLSSFSSAYSIHAASLQRAPSSRIEKTALHVGDMLSGIFGDKQQEESKGTTIFEVKAKEIKVGSLRFFLNIYLVGQANTPEKGAWQVLQNDEGSLDLYYKDGTGMLSIKMAEYAITATRYASKPSLEYVLQESIMCHGLLDELNTLAFEVDDIEEEKRLIQLNEPKDAIDVARESLPARPA